MIFNDQIQEVLFFTKYVSLQTWVESGVFNREIALYKKLLSKGVNVTFVTYGSQKDLDFKKQLGGIKIICNQYNLSHSRYSQYLSTIAPIFFKRNTILKSNQMKGADIALVAAQRFNRPFIARCGYLHAEFCEYEYGKDSQQAKDARILEQRVFKGADSIIVTTDQMKDRIIHDYELLNINVHVFPNYVETELFKPIEQVKKKKNRICFVGRMHPQKNIESLFYACVNLNIEIVIAGDGPNSKILSDLSKGLNLNVQFVGNLPNYQLPDLINSSSVFILPSMYEGNPKVLLEAMSCGVPVIGSNVPGIHNVIKHGKTGFLCETNPNAMHHAIKHVLGNDSLQKKMGMNARKEILSKYSLHKSVEKEMNLLMELTDDRRKKRSKENKRKR